jgi:hypothetical protein
VVVHQLEGVSSPLAIPPAAASPGAPARPRFSCSGAYPSALHIRWRGPEQRIAALKISEEPWPLWTGEDEVEQVAQCRRGCGVAARVGQRRPAGRLNGSSGRAVRDGILHPLRLSQDRVFLTDALPFLHVHRGPGTQGEDMSGRYDSLARNHGLPLHQLPDRPSTDQLIRRAVQDEGPRIVDKLLNSSTYLLITLGNEALAVAAQLLTGDLPDRLSPNEDSGRRHHATLRGRTLEFLPLVHPGQTVSPLETDARAVDAQHVLPLNGPLRATQGAASAETCPPDQGPLVATPSG